MMPIDPALRKTIAILGGLPDSLIIVRGNLIQQISEAGHRVVACASLSDPLTGMTVSDPVAAIRALGAEYHDIPMNRTSLDPVGDIRSLLAMRRFLRELKPDVLITYSLKGVVYGSAAGRMARVPRVCPMVTGMAYGLRDYEAGTVISKIVRALFVWAYRGVKVGIFQNKDDLATFRRLGILRENQKAVIVNGSGINIDEFTPAPFPEGVPTFLLIGRLLKGKGVFEYIEAARILKGRGHACRVQIAGPMDEHPHALKKEQIDDLSRSGVVEYLGSLKDVRPAIANCHVYVLPSYHEGTPRTVLEAMAMGRPIVTTDAPGCRETTTEGDNGFLVPVREASALADAMERFILQPELLAPMGERSREIAETKYDVRLVTRQIAVAAGIPLSDTVGG